MEGCGASEGAFFQAEIGVQIDLDGVCFLVAEPERDHRCVHARVQERHGGRVTQDVRGDRLGADRGAALPRRDRVVGDKQRDRITTERPTAAGREQRILGSASSFGQPAPQHRDRLCGERRAALLASLAELCRALVYAELPSERCRFALRAGRIAAVEPRAARHNQRPSRKASSVSGAR